MNIIVIGASKGIGRQTVKAALEKGYAVTAFSRRPASIGIKHLRLRLLAGNVLDAASVEEAVAGHDAIICALGLPTLQAMGPPFAQRSYVLSSGTKNILSAMERTGVKRLLCVTAIGACDSVAQCTPVARITLRYGLRWLFKEKDQQEQLITSRSGIDWTIVRPTALTNGRQKTALVDKDLRSGVLTHVSRAAVAAVLLELTSQKSSFHQALVVSYPRRLGDSARWVAGYLGIG